VWVTKVNQGSQISAQSFYAPQLTRCKEAKIEVRSARYSWIQLEHWYLENQDFFRRMGLGVHGISPSHNRIVLGVPNQAIETAVAELLANSGVPARAVLLRSLPPQTAWSHGSVRVVVMNEDKQPVSGIPVEVIGPDRCRTARTGADGTVTVDSLSLGLFKVHVLTPADEVAAALPNGGGLRYAEVHVTEIDTYDRTVRFMLMRFEGWSPAFSVCSPESIQRNVLPDTSPQG
jgi:hypothetical protein